MQKRSSLLALSLLAFGCKVDVTPPSAQPAPKVEAAPPDKALAQPAKALPSANRTYKLSDLKTLKATANGHELTLWVMDDENKRREGMMWLSPEEVNDAEGMIFVFDKPQKLSFWMRNTIQGLDIIYLSPTGKVLNVQQGQPLDESPLPAKGLSDKVIELKAGWAARFGIKEGTQVQLPSGLKGKP
ncbi:MAG: DUF192 domain-containing protein [Armatimonadetes bacterium]|nr:DUF192 domain-containing protein [Armatimonadota bacterium]